MRALDLAIRKLIYAHFGRTGTAPTRTDLAHNLDKPLAWVDERLADLAAQRIVVLDNGGEIAKALPFSGRPTSFAVHTESVTYYGNCAWDAFALGHLFGPSSEIDLSCGDCGEPIEIDEQTIVHFSVPASDWWDDISFT